MLNICKFLFVVDFPFFKIAFQTIEQNYYFIAAVTEEPIAGIPNRHRIQ